MKNITILISVLILSIVAILLDACHSVPKKEELVQLEYSKEIASDLLIGQACYLVSSSDYIVGLHFGTDLFFYKQNIKQSDSVYRFRQLGQGPDEFILPFSLQYINDTLIGTYDASIRAFSEISLIPHSVPLKQKTLRFDNNMSFSVLKTAYNQYIGIGSYQKGMFILFDSLGNTINPFFEFPFQSADERSIKNPLRAMAYQGCMKSNLSGTKFAYAAHHADIIHFYNIENGNIELIKKIENSFCEYTPDERDGGFSAIIKSTSPGTYWDISATDEYVYLLYSGKSYKEYQSEYVKCDILFIYDWSGNLKQEVSLNTPCKYLCVSPNNDKMWAISEIPEPTIVEFDLRPLRL